MFLNQMYISINGGESSKSYVNAFDHPEMVVCFVFFPICPIFLHSAEETFGGGAISPLRRNKLGGQLHSLRKMQIVWQMRLGRSSGDHLGQPPW